MKTLQDLKNYGFYPQNILDIGAHKGYWTDHVRNVFPESRYTLVEPIDYPELQRFHDDPKITYHNQLLLDEVREVDWYEMRNTGDSVFKENTFHFENCEPLKKTTTTLDSLFPDHSFELIKIDTQGAEIPILKGGQKIIQSTSFIILEMPFMGQYNQGVPSFLEHIQFMDDIGFIPFDIVEHHKTHGIMIQVDFIFIRKDHPLTNVIQGQINSFGKN